MANDTDSNMLRRSTARHALQKRSTPRRIRNKIKPKKALELRRQQLSRCKFHLFVDLLESLSNKEFTQVAAAPEVVEEEEKNEAQEREKRGGKEQEDTFELYEVCFKTFRSVYPEDRILAALFLLGKPMPSRHYLILTGTRHGAGNHGESC